MGVYDRRFGFFGRSCRRKNVRERADISDGSEAHFKLLSYFYQEEVLSESVQENLWSNGGTDPCFCFRSISFAKIPVFLTAT
jgi:hypothetical protein